jgi:hypothetical protein
MGGLLNNRGATGRSIFIIYGVLRGLTEGIVARTTNIAMHYVVAVTHVVTIEVVPHRYRLMGPTLTIRRQQLLFFAWVETKAEHNGLQRVPDLCKVIMDVRTKSPGTDSTRMVSNPPAPAPPPGPYPEPTPDLCKVLIDIRT